MEQLLANVNSVLNGLAPSFRGTTAQKYQELMGIWGGDATKIRAAFAEVNQRLNAALADFQTLDTQLSNHFQ